MTLVNLLVKGEAMAVFREKTTSSAVITSPLWNLTPSRMVKVISMPSSLIL